MAWRLSSAPDDKSPRRHGYSARSRSTRCESGLCCNCPATAPGRLLDQQPRAAPAAAVQPRQQIQRMRSDLTAATARVPAVPTAPLPAGPQTTPRLREAERPVPSKHLNAPHHSERWRGTRVAAASRKAALPRESSQWRSHVAKSARTELPRPDPGRHPSANAAALPPGGAAAPWLTCVRVCVPCLGQGGGRRWHRTATPSSPTRSLDRLLCGVCLSARTARPAACAQHQFYSSACLPAG